MGAIIATAMAGQARSTHLSDGGGLVGEIGKRLRYKWAILATLRWEADWPHHSAFLVG
jgi:hypothetical protein